VEILEQTHSSCIICHYICVLHVRLFLDQIHHTILNIRKPLKLTSICVYINMNCLCLSDPYSLRKILKQTTMNLKIPIRNCDHTCYLSLVLLNTSKFLVFNFTKDDLNYQLYADFETNRIYNVEEQISVFYTEINLWKFTSYEYLTNQSKETVADWFTDISKQLCNSFYVIEKTYFKHPIYDYATDARINYIVQTCTPDVKQIIQRYLNHVHQKSNYKIELFKKRRSFSIWTKWYFNPDNINGFVKRFLT